MSIRIGDQVKFLNQTGGGIVTGFDKKGYVLVADADGFEIPVPAKECVPVEGGAQPAGPASDSGPDPVSAADGDRLHTVLVYTRNDREICCTAVNASNFHLLAEYRHIAPGTAVTLFAGSIRPFERKELFRFTPEVLATYPRKVVFQAIPWLQTAAMPGVTGTLTACPEQALQRPAREAFRKEFSLDPVQLLRESSFRENTYLSGRGLVVTVADEHTRSEEQALTDDAQWEMARRELAAKDRPRPAGLHDRTADARNRASGPNSGHSRSRRPDEPLVVDLHAHELLDTTAGMDAGEILRYQLKVFHDTMQAHLHRKGFRIVFIHGKGEGVLRAALTAELRKKYARNATFQDASFQEYGFGATLVILR